MIVFLFPFYKSFYFYFLKRQNPQDKPKQQKEQSGLAYILKEELRVLANKSDAGYEKGRIGKVTLKFGV